LHRRPPTEGESRDVHDSEPFGQVALRPVEGRGRTARAILVLSASLAAMAWSAGASAQWPAFPDPDAPRDEDGNVIMDAPTPRTAEGHPDLSGLWMRTTSGPPQERRSQDGGAAIDVVTAPVPLDPDGPPIAAFFEAGQNMEGGLPYTPWARELRDERFALNARDNPDANCMPMGFLQFHQQPQPRKIIQTDKLILIEYEANYGLRHIYIDGRELPPQ